MMEEEEPKIRKRRKKVPAAANERVKSALRGIAAGEPGLELLLVPRQPGGRVRALAAGLKRVHSVDTCGYV